MALRPKEKIKVFHFNNGAGGGVLSVIKNLIEYSQSAELENHVIYTIEKRSKPTMIDIPKAASVQVFKYDRNWNFYHTCKQLKKLITDEKAVLVAHDWLELGMVSHLGMQNPVVQFLHGDYDYYYELAEKHSGAIDKYIVVAGNMRDTLKERIPDRKADIHYLRFPVPNAATKPLGSKDGFHIVFAGRLSKGKGFDKLPDIARKLQYAGVDAEWHIIGEDNEGLWNADEWNGLKVKYYGQVSNERVWKLLPSMQCIILPSLSEGMPVSIIEAMKAGVVPIVNDIGGGIQELVVHGETGYRMKLNDTSDYASTLKRLSQNNELFRRLASSASEITNKLFDPYINTEALEGHFLKANKVHRLKKEEKIYGSRLDQKEMPNLMVKLLRRSRK